MDNKHKEILQKFSTQRVDLGSFQEIKQKGDKLKKVLKIADNAWREHSDYLTGADKTWKAMKNAYSDLDAASQFAEGAYNRFEKGAKELGVDPNSSKEFKQIKEDIQEAERIFNIINDFNSPDL